MSDDEEGFAAQQAIQLIQYNYQPSYQSWTTLTKKCYPMYKKNSLALLACNSKLINNSIHSQWFQSLLSVSKPKNVVFTATVSNQTTIQQQNITFESSFQSGNMQIISRVKSNQYQLFMKPDSNTKNHFQWFYFRVNIRKANKNIKFTIKNFIKSTMLYSKGLRPYCRSLKNPQYHQYKQIESQVKFYQDCYTNCFSLQFNYQFQYDNDEVQFCSQPPYTFRHATKLIQGIKCKKLTLTKTVMGTRVPYLMFQAKKQVKTVVIAIARQHPGQTVGSWMMEGFINQLNQGKHNDFITWVVVPMVNIDGVVLGNNRTGILGHDFNRNWIIQQAGNSRYNKLFPQNQGIISLIKLLKRKHPRKVKMFLDLHGHSSQPNVFSYGPPHQEQSQYFYQCRLFPELLAKRNSNFKLSQCSYVLHPEKKNTARSIVFFNLGVPFTYTIESTFGIMNEKASTIQDFIKIGQDIATCARQFIQGSIFKDNIQSLNQIIQDIKIKYANAKNEGVQFDSASQASDQNPNRKKIEQMVIEQQLSQSKPNETLQKSSRYDQIKFEAPEAPEAQKRFRSLMKPIFQQNQLRSYSTKKQKSKKRVNTEIELVLNKKQCVFPKITTRNNKLGLNQSSCVSAEDFIQNLKIDDIQKRLQRLRNSKIGKKILVINAYCS